MSISNINIEYKFNKANALKLFESSYKYFFNNSNKRYIGWLFIAILQFGVVAALKKGSIGILIFATIVLIYWYWGKKVIAKKRAIKAYESSPLKDKTIKIKVNKDAIEVNNQSFSWDKIDRVIPIYDDILILQGDNYYYIPSNGFKSLEEKSWFKKLAKELGKV